MRRKNQPDAEMLKGTLDMMILRTLVSGEAGRKQLVRETSRWRQMQRAIGLVMGEIAASGGEQ